jgi:hypothetical protein
VSVAFENTAETDLNAVTTITLTSFSVGTNANRVLLVGWSIATPDVAGFSGMAITYGGVSLSQVAAKTNGTTSRGEIWGLIGPASGSANIVANWTGSAGIIFGAAAFSGADQTSPFQNVITNTSSSITITSAVGNMTMDLLATNGALPTSPSQTQMWSQTRNNPAGAASRGTGAATVTHSWTTTGGISHCGVDILAAGAVFDPSLEPNVWGVNAETGMVGPVTS